jgi:hypothetical protein
VTRRLSTSRDPAAGDSPARAGVARARGGRARAAGRRAPPGAGALTGRAERSGRAETVREEPVRKDPGLARTDPGRDGPDHLKWAAILLTGRAADGPAKRPCEGAPRLLAGARASKLSAKRPGPHAGTAAARAF